ncbi:MAG: 5-formyltetrahydrofolate cyclo-ligase [Gammaproteobacteria bacterium]|nr:5-formyltetrahydrofolate cyclo-ligase [Gammaproteobacteria bacterium]
MKQAQRERLCALRNEVSELSQQQCSQQVCDRIVQLPIYQRATHLALYRATGREIVLDALWQHASKAGKQCYFPKVMPNDSLCFLPAELQTPFVKNRFGILEPEVEAECEKEECALFFLPLVGFNLAGGRLGRGAGYYDRFLATRTHPYCVGVGYAFQQCNALLTEPTDYPLNVVVTELQVIEIG